MAIEVAARTAEQTRDGAWLVDLAPVFDPQLVLKAVARVLGVRERPHSSLLEDILERLRESELLLVLDNCEHLVDTCARLAEDLLRACPELRLLATSREPLGVPGERVFRTGSLTVSARNDPPDAIARADAVILFGDRAAAVLGHFDARARDGAAGGTHLPQARRPTARDRAGRSQDSVPVAGRPELAPGRLLRAADRRCADRAAAPTHAGSDRHMELPDAERAPARTVQPSGGVRRGLDARPPPRRCAPRAGIQARNVVEDLAALVDKSLVVRDALEGRRTRYRLLETLRQYGLNKLREAGEAATVRDAHLNWAVELAEEAERHLDGLDQAAWLDRLECELDNLRAALEWAITSRNPEAGLRLASITIGGMWVWRGHVPEGQRWLQRLLATPADVAATARAKGLLAAGRVDFQAGQWTRGAQLCEQSCELFRSAGDGAGEARALHLARVQSLGN